VAVLRQGVLQQIAEPRRLFREPAHRSIAGFLGWPERNFLEGVLLFEGEKLYFIKGDLRWPIPDDKVAPWSAFCGQPVILGLPPESVGAGIGHQVLMDVIQLDGFGSGTLITWQVDDVQIQGHLGAQVESEMLVQGQRHMVRLRLEDARLFDTRTGQALAGECSLT
jgi:ABC-type sugar transport system ATPase subunit